MTPEPKNPPAPMGTPWTTAAPVTDGRVRTASTTSRAKTALWSQSNLFSGRDTVIVSRLAGSNPVSICAARSALRTSSPAPNSRTTVNATSAPTRTPTRRVRDPSDAAPRASRPVSRTPPVLAARRAGATPARQAVRPALTTTNPSTVGLIAICCSAGRLGGSHGRARATAHEARTTPRAPAPSPSTAASTRNCRAIPPAARAQRGADRHLAPPREAAREQERRDVGAGDEQQQAGAGGEQHDAVARLGRRQLAQRRHADRPAPMHLRMVGRLAAGDGVHLGLRPGRRHPPPQLRDDVDGPVFGLARIGRGHEHRQPEIDGVDDGAHPELEVGLDRGEALGDRRHAEQREPGGAHAREVADVEVDGPADERFVGVEETPPRVPAEHDGAGPAIAGDEGAPRDGHAEHLEELRGGQQPAQPMAPGAVDQVHRDPPVAGDRVERRRLTLPVGQRPRRGAGAGIDAVAWCERMAGLGAGEILLTSMDRDGTRDGFDLALTGAVCAAVPVPVIASGGVGTLDHLADGITAGGADAVLAASIFHFGEYSIVEAKRHMAERGIEVRL